MPESKAALTAASPIAVEREATVEVVSTALVTVSAPVKETASPDAIISSTLLDGVPSVPVGVTGLFN